MIEESDDADLYKSNVLSLLSEAIALLKKNSNGEIGWLEFELAIRAFYCLVLACDFRLIDDGGDGAFQYDPDNGIMFFRLAGLRNILAIYAVNDELNSELHLMSDEIRGECVSSLMVYVAHEIIHHQQKFAKFSTVDLLKEGLAPFGLPILDVAADTLASFICATAICVDPSKQEGVSDNREEVFSQYVAFLMRAYKIGTEAFDARAKPEKTQRALGVLVQAALVHASLNQAMIVDFINEHWTFFTPVIALNVMNVLTFNAIVLCNLPGLLYEADNGPSADNALRLWEAVGVMPHEEVFTMVLDVLVQCGVVRLV